MTYQEAKAEAMSLLVAAQNHNKYAEQDFLEFTRLNLMPRRIGKFLSRNRQVNNDDIKQEFMIGVALSMYRAKMDIGDPMEFIMNSGIWNVRRYMKSQILRNTMQICDDCGAKHQLNRIKVGRHHVYECKKCGSHNISTYETHCHEDDSKMNAIEDPTADAFIDTIVAEDFLQRFEDSLDPNTNVYKVYIMMKNGLRDDRDNRNYIVAIADALGGCSPTNAMLVVKRLRTRIDRFIKENDINVR